MPGHYTITSRSTFEPIGAVKYLADHQQHVDNLEPPKIDDYSGSTAQMQTVTDPGELGTENPATNLAGELERLRFAIQEIKGTAQWYQSAATNLSTALPVGAFVPFAGASAPTGWLLCNGAAVSRTTFAALFAAIGTGWGVGDGSTTFNVPDLRGRVPIGAGQGAGLTSRTLATLLGEEAHVLATGELPVHSHDLSNHTHSPATGGQWAVTFPGNAFQGGTGGGAETNTGPPSNNQSGNAGSGTAHNTMQPSAVATYIIKT